MNIIGIGPMEMGVIAVIALLIFGPGKLPEVMGQAGKLVRDFRQMTAGFTGEFEKTMAEAREITSGITNEIGGVTKQVNSVTNSVKKDLAGTKKTTTTSTAAKSSTTKTSTAAKSTAAAKSTSATKSTTAAKSTSAAKSTTAAKPAIPVASREDPTAGFSLFEPEPVERPRRTRIASPAAIADVLPREQVAEPATDSAASANGAEPDSPLERARQRRRHAGYGRVHA
jgi:TatA/E family protein of Tat protein translocase